MGRPKSVICSSCNKECLKSSYTAHKKKCDAIQSKRLVDCDNCGLKVDRGEYSEHISRCKESTKKVKKVRKVGRPGANGKKTGGGGDGEEDVDAEMQALEAKLARLKQRKQGSKERPIGAAGESKADAPTEEFLDEEEDHRSQCNVCGRRFFEDRIAKHQMICRLNEEKRSKRKLKVKNGMDLRVKDTDFAKYKDPKMRAKVSHLQLKSALFCLQCKLPL